MVRSGFSLLGQATGVLLEAAPRGLDPAAIGHALAAHPGVSEVHDLHVWEVTSGFTALSAHVLVPPDADCHARRAELERAARRALRARAHDAAGRARVGRRPARHRSGAVASVP